MPLRTRTYSLEAFLYGEPYSASADNRRFVTIDNQLAFITDFFGNGRIDGWKVTVKDLSSLQISVSNGHGIINRFATYTFGKFDLSLLDNRTYFLYMKRKINVLGGFSGFSDMSQVSPVISDFSDPSVPTGLVVTNTEQNRVSLKWNSNNEVDFSHYKIYKSTNNIDFSLLKDEVKDTSFSDTDVSQNNSYYYKISSVNLSGQESSLSSSVSAITPKDLRQPLPPGNIQSFVQNNSIELFWEESESDNVDKYVIEVERLDTEFVAIEQLPTIEVSSSKTFVIVDDLVNEVPYKFTLRAESVNKVSSSSLVSVAIPSFNQGPPEVEDVDIVYYAGDNEDINVEMEVSLQVDLDPYVVPAERYYLLISENAEDTTEPILILEGETSRVIRTLPFADENGNISYRSIKTNTNYIIKVVGIDSEGNENNGVIVKTRTPVFKQPPPVSNFSIEQRDNFSLKASWINSSSEFFEKNSISVFYQDPSDSSSTYVADDLDIGNSTTYVVPNNLVVSERKFTFQIVSIDEFSNESEVITSNFTVQSSEEAGRPDTPQGQKVLSGDSQVLIQWTPLPDEDISTYIIYRSEFSFFPKPSDFSQIDSVPDSISEYIDYSVENGKQYVYFISSKDRFGNESLNPVQDSILTQSFKIAIPKQNASFAIPSGLSVSKSGFDANLTWSAVTGSIDGYEIWRSVGNKYSFERIDSVSVGTTSYTDENVLLTSGVDVYYLVRGFRNESETFLTESNVAPQNSILLAKIITNNGSISIDESSAIELKNLEDPVRTETKKQIAAHNHELDTDRNIDKRISLGSNIIVSDFKTNDYQNYTTSTDIEGALSYLVTVEGTVNEEYFKDSEGNIDSVALEQAKQGIPPFLFDVSPESGRITFETPLFGDIALPEEIASILDFQANPNVGTTSQMSSRLQAAFDLVNQGFSEALIRPYQTEPVVTLKLEGINEVTNTIANDKLESISASQVTSGLLSNSQIGDIQHEGRLNETLLPVQIDTTTEDRFTFEPEENDSFDLAETFYDVIQVSDNQILAATSQGLLLSDDFGESWTSVASFSTSPHKLFYANKLNKFFALTNDGVYVSQGDLIFWNKMDGLSNISVARDISEDSDGNLYVSTDLGVYKLDFNTTTEFFNWDQTTIFGPKSTESYAILYDDTEDRIIVSNELGILETKTQGQVWNFSDEFDEFKKIFKFIKKDNYIFALTNSRVYRKVGNGPFSSISEINAEQSRNMVIFENRIYVSTNEGVFASPEENDIFNESDINLTKSLPHINVNNSIVTATSMSEIDNFLFIGTDSRLFIKKEDNIWIQYENLIEQPPSVYVNGSLQTIGLRYNSNVGSNNVSFDDSLDVTDNVTVATKYDVYNLQSGGWAFQNYASEVFIYKNDALFASTDELKEEDLSKPDFDIDISSFTEFEFPEATEGNSYLEGAESKLIAANSSIERLQSIFGAEQGDTVQSIEDTINENNVSLNAGETKADVLSDALKSIDVYLSQIKNEQIESVELPSVIINLDGVSYNATNGKFVFESAFTKYDNIKVDIIGSTVKNIGNLTHKEIEDKMEFINSGLPSSLSQVEQSNVVKLGIFNEKVWPGQQAQYSTPFQAKYNHPTNKEWYDVLNSTVDWQIQIDKSSTNPSLPYVSDAIHVINTNEVLVGGPNGLFKIDVDTLDIDLVYIDGNSSLEIKQLYSYNDVLYVVTLNNLYRSNDNGQTWSKLSRDGLPNDLLSMAAVNNNLVLGTESGIYFKKLSSEISGWSVGLQSTDRVEIIIDPNILFALVGQQVYFSTDGSRWLPSGNEQSLQINTMSKFKSLIFIGTPLGLYKDDGTFYGSGGSLSLVQTKSTLSDSKSFIVNDIVSDGSQIITGLSDGSILYLNNNTWEFIDDSPLKSIQKLILVDDQLWAFGYQSLLIFQTSATDSGNSLSKIIERPVRLSTGVPI